MGLFLARGRLCMYSCGQLLGTFFATFQKLAETILNNKNQNPHLEHGQTPTLRIIRLSIFRRSSRPFLHRPVCVLKHNASHWMPNCITTRLPTLRTLLLAVCPCEVAHLEHAVSQEAVASRHGFSHGPLLRTFLGVSTSPVV